MTAYAHLLGAFSPVIGAGADRSFRKLQPPRKLSAVVPCYNEAEVMEALVGRLAKACEQCVGQDYELVLINDGSSDGTWDEILRLSQQTPQIIGVDLARNHGHQLALTAGLSVARGDRILIIDADLQDPPELLAEMMNGLDRVPTWPMDNASAAKANPSSKRYQQLSFTGCCSV